MSREGRLFFSGNILAKSGLRKRDLIHPVFISERSAPVKSAFPGVSFSSPESLVAELEGISKSGISNVIFFGIPSLRDADGQSAWSDRGIVQRAIRMAKKSFGKKLAIYADTCLCQYNLSGHCGVESRQGGLIDNDGTLDLLKKIALSQASAGADVVAPSAMMDGQVLEIKRCLQQNGFDNCKILSYSAKHASSLYTPFRSAAFAKHSPIDKSSYQVSYADARQAMRELEYDVLEGADMVMVKPAIAHLDLVAEAKARFDVPIVVQNVSGEYMMVKAAASEGWIDEDEWKAVCMSSIKRAGADMIVSYFASDVAQMLDKAR